MSKFCRWSLTHWLVNQKMMFLICFRARISYSLLLKKSSSCLHLTNYFKINEKIHLISKNDIFTFCFPILEGWIFYWWSTNCTICMKFALFMNTFWPGRGDASDRGGRQCQEFEFYRVAQSQKKPLYIFIFGKRLMSWAKTGFSYSYINILNICCASNMKINK